MCKLSEKLFHELEVARIVRPRVGVRGFKQFVQLSDEIRMIRGYVFLFAHIGL